MRLDYVKLLVNDYCVLLPDFDSTLAYAQFWLEDNKLGEISIYNQTEFYAYVIDADFWDFDGVFSNEYALEIICNGGYNIPTDVLL